MEGYEPILFEVDKPIPQGLGTPAPGAQGVQTYLSPTGLLFMQFMPAPTRQERKHFAQGKFEFRVLHDTHTMLFLLKYGATEWCDTPFNIHRQVAGGPAIIPADPGEGYSWITDHVMVDSQTLIVRAMRTCALTRRICLQLGELLHAQLALAPDDALHARQVAHFMRASTADLAQRAKLRFKLDGS